MKKVDENDQSVNETENEKTREPAELSADEEVAAVSDNKELSVPEELPLEIEEVEPEAGKDLSEITEEEHISPELFGLCDELTKELSKNCTSSITIA